MADRGRPQGAGPGRPGLPGAGGAGPGLPAADLADVVSRIGVALRMAGLPAGPGRCERFAAAVILARPQTARELRLCALATLTSSRDEGAVLESVLRDMLGPAAAGGERAGHLTGPDRPGFDPAALPSPGSADDGRDGRPDGAGRAGAAPDGAGPDAGAAEQGQPGGPAADRYLASIEERLATADFAELSDAELARLAVLMRQITLAVPDRRSRRLGPGPGRRRTDMRATLRQARRTGGHPFRLVQRSPARRPRRLVVLCDISGSMEPYARAMIQLLYCAAGAAGAEVFTFATRLTRLTPALARSQPGPALRRAGLAAPDWHGGTRIGSCLRDFNNGYGRRGLARGAVVAIISDGWDTGPPELLSREMQRLSLVAHQIVWVNPRTKSAAYQPLASGMAAAWPHCDAVVSGHSLAAVSELVAAIADPVRRRRIPILLARSSAG